MTDHIGDVNEMVPMTQQRLDEIKAQAKNAEAGDTDYYELMRLAARTIPDLLQEVERLRAERDVAVHALEGLMSDAMGDAAALTCPLCVHYNGDCDLPVPTCMPVWIGRKEG
jgi:hypothetical protein